MSGTKTYPVCVVVVNPFMEVPDANTVPSTTRSQRKALPMAMLSLTVFSSVLMAGVSLVNALGPDRWWWSSLNLYLPQWIWALPWLLLLPLYILRARRLAWIPLCGLLWVLGPLMGFCWRWSTPSVSTAKGSRIRVMTFNVKSGLQGMDAILQDIQDNHPDVILLQEAYHIRTSPVARLFRQPSLRNWYMATREQYMVLSRFPLLSAQMRSISTVWASRYCFRCTILVRSQRITLYTVHFISPRKGLMSVGLQTDETRTSVSQNIDTRLQQAQKLVDYLAEEHGPLILTGDLNAPVQALTCRQLLDTGLRDAFSEAGRGYGYTYGHRLPLRHDYVRIDHILISAEWKALNCWVGHGDGSDHRCVVADLYLPDSPR